MWPDSPDAEERPPPLERVCWSWWCRAWTASWRRTSWCRSEPQNKCEYGARGRHSSHLLIIFQDQNWVPLLDVGQKLDISHTILVLCHPSRFGQSLGVGGDRSAGQKGEWIFNGRVLSSLSDWLVSPTLLQGHTNTTITFSNKRMNVSCLVSKVLNVSQVEVVNVLVANR